MAGDPVLANRVAETVTKFVLGDLPVEVQRALLCARLAGIYKSTGGVRVLGCGGVIRRLVLKHASKETQKSAQEYCGKNQYGLQKDGTGRMFRHIQALLAIRTGVVVVGTDQGDAFSAVDRNGAIKEIGKSGSAPLKLVSRVLLGEPCTHIMQDGGRTEFVDQKMVSTKAARTAHSSTVSRSKTRWQ